jgi:hypothetical protein
MKVFLPEGDEEDENVSFTFSSEDEQGNFEDWLSSISMNFVKTKIVIIEEGKRKFQNCLVLQNQDQDDDEQEEIEQVEEEPQIKTRKSKKKIESEDQ